MKSKGPSCIRANALAVRGSELFTTRTSYRPTPFKTFALDVLSKPQFKKGLDGLRNEFELMPKMSYGRNMTLEEKAERRAQIARFFKHIGLPL